VSEAIGVEAPITAVTVFRHGARVVRTGTLNAAAGASVVVIRGLPASADPASVRVGIRGPGVALLDIEVRHGYGADPVREEVARLRAEVDARRDDVQALDDADSAEQVAIGFAGHLSEAAAGALARAVSFGRVGHDELDQMAGHLSASTAHALARRREIAASRRAALRELEAAEQRLAAAQKKSSPAEFIEVSAALEASSPALAQVELSYHVRGVSWRPLYDLSLTGEVLTVSYLAEITQHTGEDWPAVDLAVSTTRRGRYETLPELRPWYVSRQRDMPPQMLSRQRLASSHVMAAGMASPAAPAEEEQEEIATLPAEISDAGAGLEYRIPRPLAVPADGSPHKTTIARFEFDAILDHLAVPALAPEAYLRATVTNSSQLLLLPGPARAFHDGQFVAETALETVAPGEEFELQLGVDDQIRLRRELRRRSTSKAVIGGTRTIDIGYEITVENHRSVRARISVHDHIPVSTDGDIKVRLRETGPNPTEQSDLGELTWNLELDSGQKATVKHRFTVEHPAQVTITGL
jgi:uncharacterized protein (TIGR02231 family)